MYPHICVYKAMSLEVFLAFEALAASFKEALFSGPGNAADVIW
jgi:hypothetical protein